MAFLNAAAWAGIAAATSALSGAVAFVGSRNQAKAMENQAESAEQWGQYKAQIEKNNAQAQAQDLAFQSSVGELNKNIASRNADTALSRLQDKKRIQSAQATAAGARRGILSGSFSDILQSSEFLAEKDEIETLFQTGQATSQINSQALLNREMGDRAIEQGRVQSIFALAEGNNTSTSLQNKASAARTSGIGSFIGGVGGAAKIGIDFGE
jgi:hypothetical protein